MVTTRPLNRIHFDCLCWPPAPYPAKLPPPSRPTHLHVHAQTLALHLIEGVIDQVDGTVQVSWVQPRILTLPQVRTPLFAPLARLQSCQ